MSEREQLEQAIAAVEAQRASLGDAAANAALAGLRRKLAELGDAEGRDRRESLEHLSPGERRIVTVLFCDVAHSAELAEKLDPEEWTEIMNAAFEHLTGPVDRYGGTVARLMGDAILAFFGAPVTHEDDPQRAVRAGLAILEDVQPFRAALLRERGLDFNVRVGINTGLVVAGEVGTEVFGEFTAMGDAVNLAARMEQTAEPGTVQITESTYELVAPLFEFQPLGDISVKGKAEPVSAYRVLGATTQPGRVRGLAKYGISSPLVGRESEFAAARESVARLSDGEGGILTIIGEAGVGKSRLVAEVRRDAPMDRLNWLEGRTLSYGQTISYWPFQEILWAYTGIVEEDSEAEAWDKLEHKVRDLFGDETSTIAPYLASLLSLEVKEEYVEQVKYLDGEAMGRQIYLAARRFFKRLAETRPLVLLFEDLHWADESSALLLEHLLPLVEQAPLLIFSTSRPYLETPAARLREVAFHDQATRYSEIMLAPLSQVDSTRLTRNLLAIDNLPSSVRAMIVLKSSGNPFFLEEIIRALISTGAVIYDPENGQWRATKEISAIAIPDTIQGVIMARVDQLEEDVKRVLQTASVVGRSFFYRVLEAVGNVDTELRQHLAELEQVELIRERQAMPELEYIFNHALAQEVTYESILLRRRRALHAQVGEAIETLFAERLEEFYGRLAYHYAQAERWEKAQEYLFKAGDQAGQVAADAEALANYQQALAAYERAFGARWDPAQRAVLARKMGEAYFRRGEHEQALEHFGQAFKFLGRPPIPASRRDVRIAIARELISQLGHRLLPRLFLKPPVEAVDLAVEEEARIHYPLGWIYLFTDRERFLWASLRRLNFSEESGFLPGVASGSAALGVVWDFAPLLWLARGYHDRAVASAEQSGDYNALGVAHQGFGFHLLNLGRFEESIAHVQRADEILRETRDLHSLGNAINLMAFNNIHQGHFTEALEYTQELITNGQDGGDPQLVCWSRVGQGLAQARMGMFEEAAGNLKEGIQIAEAVPDYYWMILAYAFLGQCYLLQGKRAETLDALEEGQRVHATEGVGGPALYHLRSVQMEACLIAAGQSDDGDRATWLKKADQASKDVFKLSKVYHLYLAEALRLKGTHEWLRDKPRAAEKSWLRSLRQAEERGQLYDLGVTNLEMGRRLGDRDHLERAGAILSEIGVKWHEEPGETGKAQEL